MYWFVNDHLGTPQKIVDSTGSVVWAAAYLPFGKAQVEPAVIENNLIFTGQYFDSESGLHYNWHRYYDPDTGRYITADPIGLEGGINLYAYVENNPIRLFDFMGLESNCLGYAMTGNKNVAMQPNDGWSMNRYLKTYGWDCKPIAEASECKCECGQRKIIVMLPLLKPKSKGDTVMTATEKEFKKGNDWYMRPYHAVRADDGGCGNGYSQIAGYSENSQEPKPVDPDKDSFSTMEKTCCCKK